MKKLLTLLLALPLAWGHAAAQENAKYTILLTGASFASPQNGWFEIGCRQLDARAINRAIGGEAIADTANRSGTPGSWTRWMRWSSCRSTTATSRPRAV